jgi:hypothetical protein
MEALVIALVRLVPPGYHAIVPAAGALVGVALIAVLSAAELLRAHGAPRAIVWRRRLEIAALPLLAATAFVVVARLAPLVA